MKRREPGHAERIIAQVFSLLHPCTAKSLRVILQERKPVNWKAVLSGSISNRTSRREG